MELVHIGSEKKTKGEPIIVYESKEELFKSLEEWKHRLYLDSWTIVVGYHSAEEHENEGGHVDFLMDKQTAKISLLKPWVNDRIIKHSQEETLVHELLHLKIGFIVPSDSIEGMFYDIMQHRLIEELSHALVNAKYGIDRAWWFNDERCR